MTEPKLKRCPCGKVPDRLIMEADDAGYGWLKCSGDCCGDWKISFDSFYKKGRGVLTIATNAWNEAGRGGMKEE